MVKIAKEYPAAIASQMAGDDVELAVWLKEATFAEADSGHWLAWHGYHPERIAVLSPRSGAAENRHWMHLENGAGLDVAIARVESGEFDEASAHELNLYFCESAELRPLQDYADVEIARAFLQRFVEGNADFSDPDHILERLELIYERYGEGELKALFTEACDAYKYYALKMTADLLSATRR